jgi:hypothetical protein
MEATIRTIVALDLEYLGVRFVEAVVDLVPKGAE